MHDYRDLIILFNGCFACSHNTRLVKGEEEPLYVPAHSTQPFHALYFAHGFFSSALHECAHWLLAGEKRRQQIDFGYWYIPDGRTSKEQALFQQVEVKPQALEWILSVAAGYSFRISMDNLNGERIETSAFKEAVYHEVSMYCQRGLSGRAKRFHHALCEFYNTPSQLLLENFKLAE